MADISETSDFPEAVYEIATTDPVRGDPPNRATGAGIANIAAQELANRTRWLKNQVAGLLSRAGGTLTGFLTLHAAPTSNMHAATKLYVDQQRDTRLNQTQGDARYVNKAGDAMSGDLAIHSSLNYTSGGIAFITNNFDELITFRRATVDVARIEQRGPSSPGDLTIMTREKSDNRYLRADSGLSDAGCPILAKNNSSSTFNFGQIASGSSLETSDSSGIGTGASLSGSWRSLGRSRPTYAGLFVRVVD